MIISIEVPVFKGEFLQQCIQSVLQQSSDAWHLSLVWDGGDELSKSILEELEQSNNPQVSVYFNGNQGIAKSRAFLSAQNNYPYILPLDDDDELSLLAVERFVEAANANPWASLIRGKRSFINQKSEPVDETQWFPFGHRNYFKGMVTDVFNQAQPYLIRKSAYDRTMGWRGFDDFMQAGEDCDIFLQVEEVAHFELIDEVLYHYRLHSERASDELTSAAAFEMWRRLADDAVKRMELPLVRTSDAPPFTFDQHLRKDFDLNDVDFITPSGSPISHRLKELEISDESIVEVSANSNGAKWKMEGFRQSTKKLLCFMDETVAVGGRNSLEEFVKVLNSSEADVLAPGSDQSGDGAFEQRRFLDSNCLLVRREVILATGGFDAQHVPNNMHLVDFSIQSKRRDFTCFAAFIPGLTANGLLSEGWTENDFDKLKMKWYSHVAYLPSTSDLNRLSGDRARR
jgi:glycosyltransferase involved in cell wall biosynthesis